MMVDEKEATNGHGYDLNCIMEPKSEAENNENVGLLLDGSSGGFSFGDGTSAGGLRYYKRRKRRKMINSDEVMKSEFDDKIKAADASAPDQDNHMLSFDASTHGPGECSLRHCSSIVVRTIHESLNVHEDGPGRCNQNTFVNYQESGCTSLIKRTLDNVERSGKQTNSSAPELSHFVSCGLLNQSEGSTSSELCWGALLDILNSHKFSELCGLLLKNFDVVHVNRVLDVDAISLKVKNGAYETSPMLYLKDIQQVWTKLQQVGNEIVTLAKSLSDKSRAHYEQFVRKPGAAEPHDCQGCGENAEVRNCLVCDSCEDIYHISCTDFVGTEIPRLNWYCASCVSNGLGSPHCNCIVCEKLNASDSIPLVNAFPTNDKAQDVQIGLEEYLPHVTAEFQSSNVCYICKSEVKLLDKFKTCGHIVCPHRFYHYKCLTSRQLGVHGTCWYCPTCLCRRCLVDKDGDKIVLCDRCDAAYHIYCTSPQLPAIPKGEWFCGRCVREVKRIRMMRRIFDSLRNNVKIEDVSEEAEPEGAMREPEGLDMLVTAARRLSRQDTFWNARSNTL